MRKWWEDFVDLIASIGLFCFGISAMIGAIILLVFVMKLIFGGG